MEFVYNDGGRAAAGYKGTTGDCVCRAISIATENPYKEIYTLINRIAKEKGYTGSTARIGVPKEVTHAVLKELGWKWVPTMKIGQGCKIHLKSSELPDGRIICKLSKHIVPIINGVLHDTYDCTRNGSRCVYGYWCKEM